MKLKKKCSNLNINFLNLPQVIFRNPPHKHFYREKESAKLTI